jgi:hypothetical protein
MNATKSIKSASYERLIEHRQVNSPAKTDRDPPVTGREVKSVASDFMPLKPVFSTAC